MSWFTLAILSATTGSLTKILQKILLSNKQSDPIAFGFIFQITVAGIFLIYTLATNSLEFPDLSSVIINLILMTLFYALGNMLTFKAFKITEASEASIILASSTAWAVVSAVIFLGESLTTKNICGILMIVLGLIAVQFSRTKWKLHRGHLFALLGAILFGLAFTNDAYIVSKYHSVASYMVVAFALPGLSILFFNPKSSKNIKNYLSARIYSKVLLCALFYALSALTIFTAYNLGGQASIISPIQQTGLVLTVILSYIILKERDRVPNKVIGTVLSIFGVLLLI